MLRALPVLALCSGCVAADAAAALIVYGPDVIKARLEGDHRDTSTTHCESLPGTTWTAENGDALIFAATAVRWRHDGVAEDRSWRCALNRTIVISGFPTEWDGTFIFGSDGLGFFRMEKYRPPDSTWLFPCERLRGRTYMAESGETLVFAPPRTWRCERTRVTLEDGTELMLPPDADQVLQGSKAFLLAPDGKRPVFPCDTVPNSRWRANDAAATLVFGPTTVEWRPAGGATEVTTWSCRERQIHLHVRERDTIAFLTGGEIAFWDHVYQRVTQKPP